MWFGNPISRESPLPLFWGSAKGPGNVYQMIRSNGFGGVVAQVFEHACD
jgi:hypothetical protein